MFLGTYEPSLLEKRRLALPKKIRNEINGERVVLTVGFEECIFGFDETAWNEVVKPELEKPFFSDREARNMRRKMCMNATIIPIDIQGRIVITEPMMSYATITAEIVIIGAGDHFELWNKKKWQEYASEL